VNSRRTAIDKSAPTSASKRARWVLFAVFATLIAAAVILWRFTPLAEFVTPQRLSALLERFRDEPWAPLAIVAAFVVGGLVVFPVLLLIAATTLVFDPVMAFFVALAGTLASAVVTYAVGARFVRGTAQSAFGAVLQKVANALATRGVVAIALIRIVPVAPFSVVNIAAGSIGVRLRDYVIGTILGMAPGLVAITAFGQQLKAVLEHPTPMRVAALIAIVVGWVGLSLGLQGLVSKQR